MKTKIATAHTADKKSPQSNSGKHPELHTEPPISEKDEVKQAESRTERRPLSRKL